MGKSISLLLFIFLCYLILLLKSLFTDSEKSPLTPLCIEDAERVEDPVLFERPCKCIEDARSLVLRLDLPSASQRNFNQLDTSCLAVKVPLRGTFVLLCVDQAARTSGPLAWSFEQIASSKHFCVSDAIAELIPLVAIARSGCRQWPRPAPRCRRAGCRRSPARCVSPARRW